MNLIQNHLIHNPAQAALAADVLHLVDHMTSRHAQSLPDGWRCIIRLDTDSAEAEPSINDFLLDVSDPHQGGIYAEAKMGMLLRFPDLPATGFETPQEVVRRIEALDGADRDWLDTDAEHELAEVLDTAGQNERYIFNKLAAETLRKYGLTAYQGGIAIPFEHYYLDTGASAPIDTATGVLRIAFSGAREWQDVFFAINAADIFVDRYRKHFPSEYFRPNLQHLRRIPEVAMWVTLLDFRET